MTSNFRYCDANMAVTNGQKEPKRKGPAISGEALLSRTNSDEDSISRVGSGSAILFGRTLTARILLLLSGLLATTLLLTWLLAGGLVLLAGILVLTGHCDLPCSSRKRDNPQAPTWLRGTRKFRYLFQGRQFPEGQHENFLCTRS
jgi:hypothetical protein